MESLKKVLRGKDRGSEGSYQQQGPRNPLKSQFKWKLLPNKRGWKR